MRIALFAVAASLSLGCTKTPAYVYGSDLSKLQFHLYSANMGIYPDQSILDDPNNPFAYDPPTDDHGKWDIESFGGPVAAFYSWATVDANQPGGEAQYYTGDNLKKIFQTGLAAPSDLPGARNLAIRAFQSVLDNFPASVTYLDKNGKIAARLATFAFNGIVELGGMVQGGWVLVNTASGGQEAVKP
jgi:hypothetical protein